MTVGTIPQEGSSDPSPDDAREWAMPEDLWPEGFDDPWAANGDEPWDPEHPFQYPVGLP
jgi:hypothetical protein